MIKKDVEGEELSRLHPAGESVAPHPFPLSQLMIDNSLADATLPFRMPCN